MSTGHRESEHGPHKAGSAPDGRPEGADQGAWLEPALPMADVFDSLDTPVFVKDEKHRWVYLNDAGCRVLGRPRAELLGRSDADVYETEYARFLWEKDSYVLSTGRSLSYEARVVWSGRTHNIVSRKSRYVDPATGARYVVGVLQDISGIPVTDLSLRDSEHRLRTIFEQASVGVLVARDGRFLFVNPWVEDYSGYSASELFSQEMLSFVYPDDRDMVAAHHRARMEGEEVPAHYMFRVLTRDGKVRWVGVSGVRIDWEGQPASLNFIFDLTELRRTQDELALSEQRLRQVVDLVPHMIYARDAGGRYLLVNRTMAEACGTTVEALTGALPGDVPGVACRHGGLAEVDRQVLTQGRTVSVPSLEYTDASEQCRMLRCVAMPFLAPGGGGAVLGVCTDITRRSRMLDRLERLNETLLRFGSEPVGNIQALVALCGSVLEGVCALYSRIEDDSVEAVGMWNAPEGFKVRDAAEGHICTSVARQGAGDPVLIRNLQQSAFAESDPNVRKYGLMTYLGIPVTMGENKLGTLCVVYARDEEPGDEDRWLLSVVAAAIAVEERRLAAMDALRRREGTLRALFDATPDQIMLLATDGTVQAVNRHAAASMGRLPGEIIGRPVSSFTARGMRALDEGLFASVREQGGPVLYSEQSGGRFFEREIYPVFEASGDVGGFALYSRDITASRNAQREIVESGERFRATFEQSAVGMAHSGLDGRFLVVNDRLCAMLGYSRDELMGMRFQDVTHPDDLPGNLRLHQAMQLGDLPDYTLEKRYVRKDGRQLWVNVTVSCIQDESGEHKYNCTVVEDISLRKEVEEALLRRDAVLEAMGYAAEMFLKTPHWRDSIDKVLETIGVAAEASRAYLFRNTEDSEGRLSMTQLFEWVAPGVESQMDNDVLKELPYVGESLSDLCAVLAAKKPYHVLVRDLPDYERAILMPQGIQSLVLVPIFTRDQWWGFIGFDDCREERRWLPAELEALMAAADILGNAIARRRMEDAFLESERKFRIIAETVEDVFWITSLDRRTLIYVSPAYESHIGPREEVFRNPAGFNDRVHPSDRRRLEAHYRKPAEGAREIEYRVTRRDGQVRWIRERAFPVLDENGSMEWLAGVSSDITENREAKDELMRSLREKELLLQEVHHRVKNNLQIISSLLDMAGRRIQDPRAREIMRDTQSKIHSMAMIHLQLYGYERFDSIDIASYAKLLTWQLSQMYNAANVTPEFELSETFLPLSKAIPCGLVLSEALSNVFKHAYPDGRRGSLLLHVGQGADDTVVLRISDDGVGFPASLDPKEMSSVGLKLMGNIVRFQLGGTIDIESDGGTRITILFKRKEEGARL